MSERCPICDSEIEPPTERDYGDKKRFVCPRCGTFEVSGTVLAMLPSRLENDPRRRARLSYGIRKESRDDSNFMLTSHNLDPLLNTELPSISEQKEILVDFLAEELGDDELGTIPLPWLDGLVGILGTIDERRVERLFERAIDDGLIFKEPNNDHYGLTDEGWKSHKRRAGKEVDWKEITDFIENRRNEKNSNNAGSNLTGEVNEADLFARSWRNKFGEKSRLNARTVQWNELRSRGNFPIFVRFVVVPRLRRTDEPIDIDELVSVLGWDNPIIETGDLDNFHEQAFNLIYGWVRECISQLGQEEVSDQFLKAVLTDAWISHHHNPITSENLKTLLLTTTYIIRHPFKSAFSVIVVGGAIVVATVGYHAADEIGDALGKLGAEWIDDRKEAESAVERLDLFAEIESLEI
ncbi:hypothetical protein [Nisaea sediminum]|uniref:hypothetical protein n=1 Tax=Nisaea sediminum TaxID=2775867 RepID=UPI001868110A|nr:hypothetical protein [Nisaea sediminum]